MLVDNVRTTFDYPESFRCSSSQLVASSRMFGGARSHDTRCSSYSTCEAHHVSHQNTSSHSNEHSPHAPRMVESHAMHDGSDDSCFGFDALGFFDGRFGLTTVHGRLSPSEPAGSGSHLIVTVAELFTTRSGERLGDVSM